MSYTRSPQLLDKLELTLPIPRHHAQEIYDRINKNWDTYSSRPRTTNPVKHRYKYGYTFTVSDGLDVEIYLIPIGKGQSSVKVCFNPEHLTEDNIVKLLNFLRRTLGYHAYRIYYESMVTRYDVAYDFFNLQWTKLEYFVRHLGDAEPRLNDDDLLTSLTFGAYGGPCYLRIYDKGLERFVKTGDSKYLNQEWTRFEFQIRQDIPFYKLWEMCNIFERINVFNFDVNDKSLVRNFVQSHKKNRDKRLSLIKDLKDCYLHDVIRTKFGGDVDMLVTAFKPYREHLFPGNKQWAKKRAKSLALLERFKPNSRIIDTFNLSVSKGRAPVTL